MKWKEAIRYLKVVVDQNKVCDIADVRLLIAKSIDDQELLWELAKDKNSKVADAAAARITDHSRQLKLAESEHANVRATAIRLMTEDERYELAAKTIASKVPPTTEERFRHDSIMYPIVNRTTSQKTLGLLTNDYNTWVRLEAASRITDQDVLWSMRDNKNQDVLRVVAERIDGLGKMLYILDKVKGSARELIEECIERCLSDAEKEDTV